MHIKEKKRDALEYNATNTTSARLSRPVFNPLFGNNSTRFIEAAGVTLIAICQGSFITRARDIRIAGKCFRLSVYRSRGNVCSISGLATATMSAECVPQITVELVITVGKKRTRILIGAQLKFIGLHAIQFIVSGALRARVYINSMTAEP